MYSIFTYLVLFYHDCADLKVFSNLGFILIAYTFFSFFSGMVCIIIVSYTYIYTLAFILLKIFQYKHGFFGKFLLF